MACAESSRDSAILIVHELPNSKWPRARSDGFPSKPSTPETDSAGLAQLALGPARPHCTSAPAAAPMVLNSGAGGLELTYCPKIQFRAACKSRPQGLPWAAREGRTE